MNLNDEKNVAEQVEGKKSEDLSQPIDAKNTSDSVKPVENKPRPIKSKKLAEISVETPNLETLNVDQELEEVKPAVVKNLKFKFDLNKGLTDEQVLQRETEGKVNVTNSGSSKTIKEILFTNIVSFFNILIVLIGLWIFSVGNRNLLSYLFILIITANICIGIFQEIRAKKTIDRLSLLSAPVAFVIRNGVEIEIPVSKIVLDELMLLSPGKQICADGIVKSGMIEVDESMLTGESVAIQKKIGDKVFSGSFVVSGNCRVKVESVGKDNYIEQLTEKAKKYIKPRSELFSTLKIIFRIIGIIIIPLALILFFDQYSKSGDYVKSVLATTAAMVGMIPSGLFLLTSVSLFTGVWKLANRNTLVQELFCIEMLARVDTLCLDKTGTITDGTMKVSEVKNYFGEDKYNVKQLVCAMNRALKETNQTAAAFDAYFGKDRALKTSNILPFASSRKYSAVTFENEGTFALGAPEFIMKDNYESIREDVEKYAEKGMRVLMLANCATTFDKKGEFASPLIPVALIAVEDNVREDAEETIQLFKDRGVKVIVISGDNPLTVSRIAQKAGIENADKYISLDGIKDDKLVKIATKYTVFGRVTPDQKKLLVTTLKASGRTVAMTGDGVNDILALKEADCSIAMASGSEAARNVSHLVLLDSKFSSLPKVVSEGRRVINNVQKVASLFLTKTIFSVLLAVICIIISRDYPFANTSQMIMFDFLIVGLPSAFLALEPNDQQIKGKFIVNVVKNALPGALVIILNALIVFSISEVMDIQGGEISTLIIFATTAAGLMVLLKMCRPFNKLKFLLFISMVGACLFMSTNSFTAGLLGMSNLNLLETVLLILLIENAIIFTLAFSKFFAFLETTITSLLVKRKAWWELMKKEKEIERKRRAIRMKKLKKKLEEKS